MMGLDRKPYRDIPDYVNKADLRSELARVSAGSYIIRFIFQPDSQFEILYDNGILWRRFLSDTGSNKRVEYGLTEEARKDLGIDKPDVKTDTPFEWEREMQPEALPQFSYKVSRQKGFASGIASSETDRIQFLQDFVGRLGDVEFSRRDFENFLGEFGYVKSDSYRLLKSMYDVGLIEHREISQSPYKWYVYRIPEDVQHLANTPAEHII